MAPHNLWGELPESTEHKPPVTILKEQAKMLEHLTKGVLSGNVRLSTEYNSLFVWSFEILAPALDYSYEVLRASHDVSLYPVIVTIRSDREDEVECRTEEEFEHALGKVLSSPHLKSVIASLLSQSKILGTG